MKFRYLAGLLVALSFNSGFAADVEIDASDYQGIYEAFTRRSAADINAALKNNQDFNHKADGDAIRSSATGLALRTAVIGLGFADLKTVVEINHGFFKTSLGVSLLHGWALNQFKDAVTPNYIGYYFSFNKMFQGLATNVGAILGASDAGLGATATTFFQSAFTRGLAAVEADRWAFYDHMMYLPHAIAQVRLTASVGADAPLVDVVIADARRSAMEARTEAANLVSAKAGRTIYLDVIPNPTAIDNLACADLPMVQKCILQRPELFTFGAAIRETLLSLPAGTLGTYQFMGQNVAKYITAAQGMTKNEFLTGRVGRIPQLVRNFIQDTDQAVKVEALKTAVALVRLLTLRVEDADSFPGYMVVDDEANGRDAYLVRELAKQVRKMQQSFMQGDANYNTVVGYADTKALRGMLNYKPERIAVCAVMNSLRLLAFRP